MAKHIKLPADTLVVFWVNSVIRNRVKKLPGTNVVLVACNIDDLDRHKEKLFNYKIIFSDDYYEARTLAYEFGHKSRKREVMKGRTAYMYVNPAVA